VPIRLFLPGGPPTLAKPNRAIDEVAAAAGRDPSAVRRILTFPRRFARPRGGLLDGPPAQWVEELAEMALRYGVGTFVLGANEAATVECFAAEVVPRTRELVAAERQAAAATA
jgi:alkanesulfonate monooxygenase SsuD/methylene tetrahydromethanopterin reductase-like flavin-dependent oxidoreductase (luciferase family)